MLASDCSYFQSDSKNYFLPKKSSHGSIAKINTIDDNF